MGKKKAKVRNHHAKVHPTAVERSPIAVERSPIEVEQAFVNANKSAVPGTPFVSFPEVPPLPPRKRGFWERLFGTDSD